MTDKTGTEVGMVEDFITPEELAKRWKVSRQWIYRLVQGDRIPFFRLAGKVIRFSPEAIAQWLEKNQHQKYHRDKN